MDGLIAGGRESGGYTPNDVNFYNIKNREKDSKFVGAGSYSTFAGAYHGNYPPPERASAWFRIVLYVEARGSTDNSPDTIYTGDPGGAATGAAPPFTPGSGHFPIVWQWKVRSGSAKNFPIVRQEARIRADGRCESRKAHSESTRHTDPTSTY